MQDTDIAGILRDLVEFLECLGEVELSESLQASRETLLTRSRAALELSGSGSDSPEPYLDMNAGKSLLLLASDEQPQEYIGADEQQAQRGSLHYYETFQDFQANGVKVKEDGKTEAEKKMDNVVLLYASFSATQAKERSVKSGSLLHLRREKKMFAPFNVFWMNRQCWVSLVGTHLLLYASERESRPYLVVPLRGYKSRPATTALPRDSRRSDAAFEVYCPGDRTFQFVAKNTQDMNEWVQAVTESLEPEACGKSKTRAQTFVEILDLESNERICIERVKEEQEKYQDVLNSPKSKIREKQPVTKSPASERENAEETKEEENAPPLPARRLPPLPSPEMIYEQKEEFYDEEGIYHKIEDIKAHREYQNCQFRSSQSSKEKKNVATVDLVQETYVDVIAIDDKSKMDEPLETYDDVHSIVQNKSKNELVSYDDVQTVAENLRAKVEKEKSPKPSKTFHKLSKFSFDRVLNRKESVKKDDKKPKSPAITTISSPIKTTTANNTESELPCYDDISNLTIKENCETEEENYLSPPPPRPIYSRPPTIIKCTVPNEEIYDDIGSCIEVNGNTACKGCATVDVIKTNYEKNGSFLSDLQLSIQQEQHYQVPKSGIRKVVEYQEELYDDVALSQSFPNRPRDSVSPTSPEKSVWSRFGSGKMPRILSRQPSSNESAETNDENSGEQQQTRVKPFQKLISKVENSLGKATKTNGVAQN